MINSKYFKVLMLGICVSALSYGVAFAETTDNKDGEMTIQIESTAADTTAPDSTVRDSANSELTDLQNKIDQYVFVDHYKDIEDKGFMVTRTGQVDTYIEVGIAPYSEENANYIYELFGKDNIKVVKGEEAVLYASAAEDTAADDAAKDGIAKDEAASSTDTGVDKVVQRQEEVNKILFEDKASEIEAKGISIYYTTPIDNYIEVGIAPFNEDNANYIKSLIGEDMVQVIEGKEPELMATSGLAEDTVTTAVDDSKAAEAQVVSVTDTGAEETDSPQNNLLPIIGIAGVTIILGGVVIFNQKKKTAK